MNRSQKIALAVGVIWAVVTLMLPPVSIPATGLPGATHDSVALAAWNSANVHHYGVYVGYLAGELIAIGALIAGLIYFLKNPSPQSRRRR